MNNIYQVKLGLNKLHDNWCFIAQIDKDVSNKTPYERPRFQATDLDGNSTDWGICFYKHISSTRTFLISKNFFF